MREARHGERLRPADRLHRRGEFLSAQRLGLRCQTAHFVIYINCSADRAAKNELARRNPVRLGITVSRRVGIAVARNRLKRCVRECFRRRLRRELPRAGDLVVIARVGAAGLDFKSIGDELAAAAARLRRRTAPDLDRT